MHKITTPNTFIKNIAIELRENYEFENFPLRVIPNDDSKDCSEKKRNCWFEKLYQNFFPSKASCNKNEEECYKQSESLQPSRQCCCKKNERECIEKSESLQVNSQCCCKKNESEYHNKSNSSRLQCPSYSNKTKIEWCKQKLSFIGRDLLIHKFSKYLQGEKGVYLVTGYRGMGKTSFVNFTLNKLIFEKKNCPENSNQKDEIIYIPLTISQHNPKEGDVLKQLINAVDLKFQEEAFTIYRKNRTNEKKSWIEKIVFFYLNLKKRITRRHFLNFFLVFFVTIISTYLIFLTLIKLDKIDLSIFTNNDFFPNPLNIYYPKNIPTLILAHYFSLTVCILIAITFYYWLSEYDQNDPFKKIKKDIDFLKKRAFAPVTTEQSREASLGISSFTGKFFNKQTIAYPIASSKELESGLSTIISEIVDKFGVKFVFVFDELDKIELTLLSTLDGVDSLGKKTKDAILTENYRNRKQAVLNIISGLKGFFSTTKAHFVFIAGREMFDASLADVADKQSQLSSIFTDTFHVESLLKEEYGRLKIQNTNSISNVVEEYIRKQLLIESIDCRVEPCDNCEKNDCVANHNINDDKEKKCCHTKENVSSENEKEELFDYINRYERFSRDLKNEEFNIKNDLLCQVKLNFIVQALVTYLVYRSSGSPKKLKRAFYEFVAFNKQLKDEDLYKYIVYENRENNRESIKTYLYFDYNNQYRLGFINYIYRPFIIHHGRTFKQYSENTAISMPYLFDHFFKFHPFAFSFANLELIPDLLVSNKTPTLKQDMHLVLDYLYQSGHIKDTDIELFEYKFYSQSSNEITYISRLFEEEAAAYNFTLDESYPVKLLLAEKIDLLRTNYSKFDNKTEINPQRFPLAHLNINLADLHFFDQEFADAINCYSEAIRAINHIEVDKLNMRDFITLVKTKLKLGLCFLKMNSFEESLAFFSDAVQNTIAYTNYHLTKGKKLSFEKKGIINQYPENKLEVKQEEELLLESKQFITSSLNDLSQIFIQSFISIIYVQEKLGLEGMTTRKSKLEASNFFKIIERIGIFSGINWMIQANWCLHYGNLLYYKNTAVSTVYDKTNFDSDYPLKTRERLRFLLGRFMRGWSMDVNNNHKREPRIAFAFYFIGLDNVLWTRGKNENESYFKIDHREAKFNFGNNDENFKSRLWFNNYLENISTVIYLDKAYTNYHHKYIATFLSYIGDCILGLDNNLKRYQNRPFNKIFNHYEDCNKELNKKDVFCLENLFKKDNMMLSLADVFRCYFISAKFYEKYGRLSSAIYQYKKILYLFKIVLCEKWKKGKKVKNKKYITLFGTNQIDIFQNKKILGKTLVIIKKHVKQLIEKSFLNTGSHMQGKLNKNLATKIVSSELLELFVANSSVWKEILVVIGYIETKCNLEKGFNYSKRIFQDDMINPTQPIITQLARIYEMDLYCKKIETTIDEYNVSTQDILDFIYTKNQIIKTLKTYESSYMLGPSFLAYTHFTLARFLKRHFGNHDNEKLIRNELDKFSGGNSITSIDCYYHYSEAKFHYENTIQLHEAGMYYKKMVKSLVYLEDDFNDDYYHFGAAVDRYLMTNEVFKNNIDKCNEYINKYKKI